MRIVMLHLYKIWAALALLSCAVAGQCIAVPPLETYGRLPGFEMAAISPSGDRVAIVGMVGSTRQLIVFGADGTPMSSNPLGDQKVRWIRWADENRILTRISWTIPLGVGFTAAKSELSSVLVFTADASKLWPVFGGKSTITGGVRGFYGIRIIDDHPYGFFGGMSIDGPDPNHQGLTNGRPNLYRVDLDNGDTVKIAERTEQDSYRDWAVGADGKLAAVLDLSGVSGGWRIRSLKAGWVATGKTPTGSIDLSSLGRTADTVLYVVQDDETAEVHWFEQSLAGGPPQEMFSSGAPVDIHVDRATGLLIGYRADGDVPEDHFFDSRRDKIMVATRKAFPGLGVRLVDWNDAFDKIIVQTEGPGDPRTWWKVDIRTGAADPLGAAYPMAENEVGPMRMVRYSAADGLALGGVLTLPPGLPERNLPVVVLLHGGPDSRDYPGFDWWAQAFASRGYAVFQPNFRGSDGFGAAFRRAGWGEWGRKMQTDVSDGLAELAKEGVVDSRRACIVGGSYGGYAALAGVTLQQGLYRCAVSVAGISNLASWRFNAVRESGWKAVVARSIDQGLGPTGDIKQRSPITCADRADAPLLLIHGKDDIVVPFSQSTDMAAALKRAGKPVEFVTLAGVDHWLSKSETRLQMLKASVEFVEKHNPPDPAPAAK